jgi:hypothetical protein
VIDRIVHHAEIVSLRGDSYRLKDKDLGPPPPQNPPYPARAPGLLRNALRAPLPSPDP